MSDILQRKLTPAQLRLLDLFQHSPNVPEEVWEKVRASVARYLTDQLAEDAQQFTDEQGWTDEDFQRMARTRMRSTE